MKAAVVHGAHDITVEEVPYPELQPDSVPPSPHLDIPRFRPAIAQQHPLGMTVHRELQFIIPPGA